MPKYRNDDEEITLRQSNDLQVDQLHIYIELPVEYSVSQRGQSIEIILSPLDRKHEQHFLFELGQEYMVKMYSNKRILTEE